MKIRFFFLIVILNFVPLLVFATDSESTQSYEKAISEFKSGNYRDAAKDFEAARLFADDLGLKVNAMKMEAQAYRKADLKYQEYKVLNDIVNNYPNKIDYDSTIKREYDIGNDFYLGYREVPWTWFPWLKDDDKSLTIYESILKQAPFAKFVPEMMLKMGTRYTMTKQYDKAIDTYKEMMIKYKASDLTRIAYLDLANIYVQQAHYEDGDGVKAKEAKTLLLEYLDKYPNTAEVPWVKNTLKEVYSLEANRLLALAQYYYKSGNNITAKRYARDVIVNYSGTQSEAKAESLLTNIEMPIYPYGNPNAITPEVKSNYIVKDMVETKPKLMVSPQNSNRKWLAPVDSTGISQDKTSKEEYINQL